MSDLLPITVADQIACVERELDLRRKVYLRLVGNHSMSARKADYEIAAMEAVLKTLKKVQRQGE